MLKHNLHNFRTIFLNALAFSLFNTIVFALIIGGILEKTTGVSPDKISSIGSINVIKITLCYTFATLIFTLFSFTRKKLRLASIGVIICWLLGVLLTGYLFYNGSLQLNSTKTTQQEPLDQTIGPITTDDLIWQLNKRRVSDKHLDQFTTNESLSLAATEKVDSYLATGTWGNLNDLGQLINKYGYRYSENNFVVVATSSGNIAQLVDFILSGKTGQNTIYSKSARNIGANIRIQSGNKLVAVVISASPYVSPVVAVPQPNTAPANSNDPWGVQKQIDSVTWTMKVGNDSSMATASEIYEALNNYRMKYGRSRLQWDQNLANYADTRTTAFVKLGNIDKHAGFIEFTKDYNNILGLGMNRISENISYGYQLSGVHVIEWAYSDKPHDDNQLNPDWNYVGISVKGTATALEFGAK